MADTSEMSREEKLEWLANIEASDDTFTDYSSTILQFVDDPDVEVRAQAVRSLWDYPDAHLIDTLMDKAKNDPAQEVRSAALAGLGRYIYEGEMADYEGEGAWPDLLDEELSQEDFERTRDFLLSIARDAQASLDARRSAMEALSFLSDGDVTDLIEQAYQDPDVQMKASAIFAMGRQGTVRWKNILLRELDSPVPELRYEAVLAVGESFLEEATPRLIQIAETTGDKDLSIAAILSLGKTGGDDALTFLDEWSASPDEDEDIHEAVEAALEDWYTYHGYEAEDDEDWEDDDDGEED